MSVCLSLSVCPPARVQPLGSLWTDYHDILYLSIFRKSVEKFQVSFKSDKNNRHFTCRPIYILITSRSVLLRMRNVSEKVVGKIKTHILCSVTFFKNRAVYEIMWENIVERDRTQIAIWRMRIACWIPKATNTHTHTLRSCNTYCFSTTTMVTRTRLNVKLYVQYIGCLAEPLFRAVNLCELTNQPHMYSYVW